MKFHAGRFEKFQLVITPLFAFIFLLSSTSAEPSPFAGGSGTLEDPYRIATIQQLQYMGDNLDKHFILVNDIDASPTRTWDETAPGSGRYHGFNPVGDEENQFTGTFNGNGHTISGLSISRRSNYTGLFGFISISFTIGGPPAVENVGLVDARIVGHRWTGGLAGQNEGVIRNSYVEGSVSGGYYVGGLAGTNTGVIENSHADVTVRGNSEIGGLVGYSTRGTVRNSYAAGDIRGRFQNIGGLVGHDISGVISDSYAAAAVAAATEDGARGGLVGRNYNAKILRSYSTGTVNYPAAGTYGGGLAGRKYEGDNYEDTANFYDSQASGWDTSQMGAGMTTGEMKKLSTFRDAGWEIVRIEDFDPEAPAVWFIDEGVDYPRLNHEK